MYAAFIRHRSATSNFSNSKHFKLRSAIRPWPLGQTPVIMPANPEVSPVLSEQGAQIFANIISLVNINESLGIPNCSPHRMWGRVCP